MRFEKVSFGEYVKSIDGYENYSADEKEDVLREYEDIKLPKRATAGSAGYDFFAPFPFKVSANGEYPATIKIATGIRVLLDSDKVLKCYPRSGHGFKFRLQLDNTVGVIDSDYSLSDNEGHIFAKITIDAKEDGKTLTVNKGEAFMQGIIERFYLVDDDSTNATRNGGFGSTSLTGDLTASKNPYATGGYIEKFSVMGKSPSSCMIAMEELNDEVAKSIQKGLLKWGGGK